MKLRGLTCCHYFRRAGVHSTTTGARLFSAQECLLRFFLPTPVMKSTATWEGKSGQGKFWFFCFLSLFTCFFYCYYYHHCLLIAMPFLDGFWWSWSVEGGGNWFGLCFVVGELGGEKCVLWWLIMLWWLAVKGEKYE